MSKRRVLVVAQAFKGTLGVAHVASSLAQAVHDAGRDPVVIRASDGGDGLLEALEGRIRVDEYPSCDPLGRPLRAAVGWLGPDSVVIESRLACGLSVLAPPERDPLRTSTRGVGLLLDQVVRAGAATVVVGLGGSATVDGGVGMARVWGWEPVGAAGPLPEGGGALEGLLRLVPGTRPDAVVIGLADVRNPLVGPDGAAAVFAPQKGAGPDEVVLLERGLERLVGATGEVGASLARLPGSGAAGGLGFGLLYFAGAHLRPGAAWVLDRVGFDQELDEADLVVTAEGAFDRTSIGGKLTGEVIARAARAEVPVLVVTPRAEVSPPDVVIESAPGEWSADDLARHAARGIARVLRLLH